MKLLFDQNLSPRLANRLADLFPGSTHVQVVGLDSADDEVVWDFARDHGLTVVSKDEDFDLLGVLRGAPPKLIWLQLGNCTTSEVEQALRDRYAEIAAFEGDVDAATLVIR